MKKKKCTKIPVGAGYGLGLIFGLAMLLPFAVGMGNTFFGITLGISFSLSTGIAFECAFAGDKPMPMFQKVLLSLSVILLMVAVASLLMWNGN